MSHAQRMAQIGRYQQFLVALNEAADRSFSPEQSAFYRKYAAKTAGMLSDLGAHNHRPPVGAF